MSRRQEKRTRSLERRYHTLFDEAPVAIAVSRGGRVIASNPLLDSWLGVFPLFTIVLVVVAAVGAFVRLKYVYDATMERLEAERRASRVKDAA